MNYENNTDWIEVCLPLAEQVEEEQYEPTLEELVAFNEE